MGLMMGWWCSGKVPGDASRLPETEARVEEAISTAEVIRTSDVVHSAGGGDVPVNVARPAPLIEAADAAVIAHVGDLDARGEHGAWESSLAANIRMEMARLTNARLVRTSGQVIILRGVADIISTGGTVIDFRSALSIDRARQAPAGLIDAMPGPHIPLGVVDGIH